MNRLTVSRNPLLQLAGLVVGAVVAVGAVLLGAVVLAFILGFAVIAGLILYVRLWWMRRQLRQRRPGPRGRGGGDPPGEIVEVEYTVVEERTVRDQDRN